MLSTNINLVKNHCSVGTFTYFINKNWWLGLFLVLISGVLPGCSDEITSSSEGTIDNPNIFTYAPNVRLTGEVGNLSSYYKVEGLTVGKTYDVTLGGFKENLELFVHADGFKEPSSCEVLGNDSVKTCPGVALGASNVVYLEIKPTAYQSGTVFSLFFIELP